jgi:hypothetical protein
MTDANPWTPPKAAAAAPTRAQRVLASLIGGAGLDEIGAAEKLTRKRTEKILRDELRRRWVAPAQEFARLQIARLDSMILKLSDRVQEGDLKAIDRALKIVDRLDRYHGFTRANRAPEQYGEEERARLCKRSTTSLRVSSPTSRRNERHSFCSGSAAATRVAAWPHGLSARHRLAAMK